MTDPAPIPLHEQARLNALKCVAWGQQAELDGLPLLARDHREAALKYIDQWAELAKLHLDWAVTDAGWKLVQMTTERNRLQASMDRLKAKLKAARAQNRKLRGKA